MKIYTIGFTQKSAEEFFTRIIQPGLVTVFDTRLNNTSQLAGFTKKNDLRFFLSRISAIDYVPLPELVPSKKILDEYKKNKGEWAIYERQYLQLLADRQVEKVLDPKLIDGGCFLCSEAEPHLCHRRLAAEYLAKKWEAVEIVHL